MASIPVQAVRRSPPWVVSLIVHMILLALFGGYVALEQERIRSDGMVVDIQLDTPETGDRPAPKAVQAPARKVEKQPDTDPGKPESKVLGMSGGNQPDEAEKTQDPKQSMLEAMRAADQAQSKIAGPLARRTAKGRRKGIGLFGGSGATESAVESGLRWLARHQDTDGRWDSDDHLKHCPAGLPCRNKHEPRGFAGYDVAQTGLALLAFLGAGYTPQIGPFKQTVRRAIGFLLRNQQPDGSFRLQQKMGAKFFYNHAIATFALAEAYGLTRHRTLRNRVRNAIKLIETSQNRLGGWNYLPRSASPEGERNDSSVTGWVVMALESARIAGVHVDQKALVGAIRHLRRMTPPTGALKYVDDGKRQETNNAITAVGLFCRRVLGQPASADVVARAAAVLAAEPPDHSQWNTRNQCLYYWYYGTLAAFLQGGDLWARWNSRLKPALLGSQITEGHSKGCWPAESLWARQGGGRIYATALGVLCLETYYKYVPNLLTESARNLERHWGEKPSRSQPGGALKANDHKVYSGSPAAKGRE